MRRLTQLLLAVVAAVTLTPVAPASAQTCSNIPCVATALKSNPVYQDPAAEVKLSSAQQQELRDKIGTREPRVFIALLPLKAADANGGVNEVPGKIGAALGIPSSVGVIAGTNFRARSGGGAPFATNQISKLATDAFEANNPGKTNPRGDVMPMLLSFIDAVHNAPQVQPTTPSANSGTTRTQTQFQPAKKKSHTGRNILIGLLILLFIGAIIGGVILMRTRQKFQNRKADLESRISSLGTNLYTLENGGDTFNTIAKAHIRKANNYYATAKSDLEGNDLDGAESNLEYGRSEFNKADAMANEPEPAPEPPPAPITIPVDTTKRAKKGQAKIKEAAVDPEGRIVINNTVQVPRQQQEPGYNHYFPGGYYGGRYIYGGYYPMSFWDYMVLDSIMDDRRDAGGYHSEHGGDSNREAATVGGGSWDGGTSSSDTGDTGDWDGSPEESTGGGSWGNDTPSSDPEPSYSPPAYDPPSPSYDPSPSWGGGDTSGGGGWDSGGGGGGGGGDSGGGGW